MYGDHEKIQQTPDFDAELDFDLERDNGIDVGVDVNVDNGIDQLSKLNLLNFDSTTVGPDGTGRGRGREGSPRPLTRRQGVQSLQKPPQRSVSPYPQPQQQQQEEQQEDDIIICQGLPMKDIVEPNDVDVLNGRGGGMMKHPGNVTFRNIIASQKDKYLACNNDNDNDEKHRITKSIISTIRTTYRGRFLDYNSTAGTWYDIGNEKAYDKVQRALRQKKSSKKEGGKKEITTTTNNTNHNNHTNNHTNHINNNNGKDETQQRQEQQQYHPINGTSIYGPVNSMSIQRQQQQQRERQPLPPKRTDSSIIDVDTPTKKMSTSTNTSKSTSSGSDTVSYGLGSCRMSLSSNRTHSMDGAGTRCSSSYPSMAAHSIGTTSMSTATRSRMSLAGSKGAGSMVSEMSPIGFEHDVDAEIQRLRQHHHRHHHNSSSSSRPKARTTGSSSSTTTGTPTIPTVIGMNPQHGGGGGRGRRRHNHHNHHNEGVGNGRTRRESSATTATTTTTTKKKQFVGPPSFENQPVPIYDH